MSKTLTKVNVFPEWRDLRGITATDDYVYGANGTHGLLILDTSNPSKPAEMELNKTIDFVHWVATKVAIEGGYVYVVDANNGLRVIDMSTLTEPLETSIYKSPIIEAEIQPPYAYLAMREIGLYVIDISNPTTLRKVSVYDRPSVTVWDVAVSDNYAYIIIFNSKNEGIIEIIDISDPTEPVKVGDARVSFASDIALKGSHAFVANYTGLQILDVSNPFSPSIIASYETPNSANTVKIEGDYAYIGDTFGVEVVDISDIHSPRRVAYSKLPQVQDIAVVDDYIYVADSFVGLIIYEHP